MRTRSLRFLVLLSAVATGLAVTRTRCVKAAGLDLWSLGELRAALAESGVEGSALAKRFEEEQYRRQLTESVILRLGRGQQTLAESSREVERLIRDFRGWNLASLRQNGYPDASSDRGVVVCYLIDKLKNHLADDSSERHAILARVRAELDGLELDAADRLAILRVLEQSGGGDNGANGIHSNRRVPGG